MLKAENLTLNVDDEGGKKCLLNNISFQVEDGEMLVITGPNGGGKSTLAKTLIGIQTPDSGKIILDGLVKAGIIEDDSFGKIDLVLRRVDGTEKRTEITVEEK